MVKCLGMAMKNHKNYVSITALSSTSVFFPGKTLPFFDKEVGNFLDFFFPKCRFD
jgi:hypothetical protein